MSAPETATMAPALPVAQMVGLALDALAPRALLLTALVMAFGLFAFAVWQPTWPRLAASAAFAVLVFLPLLWRQEARDGA